jgi:hypothetical protein
LEYGIKKGENENEKCLFIAIDDDEKYAEVEYTINYYLKE